MSLLQQFFIWLVTYASHYVWLAVMPPTRPATASGVIYGGNFVDAWNIAHYFGGFVSQVLS